MQLGSGLGFCAATHLYTQLILHAARLQGTIRDVLRQHLLMQSTDVPDRIMLTDGSDDETDVQLDEDAMKTKLPHLSMLSNVTAPEGKTQEQAGIVRAVSAALHPGQLLSLSVSMANIQRKA